MKDKPSSKEIAIKRIQEAQASYLEMEKQIKPFIKRRKITPHLTTGKWRETSNYFLE